MLVRLVMVLEVMLGVLGKECQEEELQQMQEDFNNCTNRLVFEFEDTRQTFPDQLYVEEAACLLFSKTLGECSLEWSRCHTKEEVARLQDQHLELYVVQYSDVKVDHCPIVQDYFKSGRRESNTSPDRACSDSQTVAAQKEYQDCSQSEAIIAHQLILEGEEEWEGKGVRSILCNTLNNISSVCTDHFRHCFGSKDLRNTMENNLEVMRDFLVRLAGVREEELDLDDCLHYTVTTEEEEEEKKEDESKNIHVKPQDYTLQHHDKDHAEENRHSLNPDIGTHVFNFEYKNGEETKEENEWDDIDSELKHLEEKLRETVNLKEFEETTEEDGHALKLSRLTGKEIDHDDQQMSQDGSGSASQPTGLISKVLAGCISVILIA